MKKIFLFAILIVTAMGMLALGTYGPSGYGHGGTIKRIVKAVIGGDTNLLGWYEWTISNECANGHYVDSGVYGNHGTQATANARATWYPEYLDFDGVDDGVDIPLAAFTGQLGTISVWLRIASSNVNYMFFASCATNDNNFQFFLGQYTPGRMRYWAQETATDQLQSLAFTISENVFEHHVWVSDGSTITAYHNGIAQTLSVVNGSNSGRWADDITKHNASFGNRKTKDFDTFYDIDLDEPRFYSDALTSNEVYALYQEGR